MEMNGAVDNDNPVAFDAARRIVTLAVEPLGAECVPLSNASGRVAAEEVTAEEDLVPYARSAMDGYALRTADITGASAQSPVSLPIAGEAFPGEGDTALSPRTVIAITTGTPLPRHADAVIPYERIERREDMVFIREVVAPGNCVFPPAEDVRRGELLVRRGEVLRPASVALLAFVGKSQMSVFRRPRVSVLCTGNELVDVSVTPRHGQVRNTNAYSLMALLSGCGADARYCGMAEDDPGRLRSLLQDACRETDLVITTGGASVGRRDLVKSVLESLGAHFAFRRVAARPGKPFGFARWEATPVCVLPGNPAAAFVAFHEFVRPALFRMAGREKTELTTLQATLAGRAKSKAGSRYVILAQLLLGASGFSVRPLANQCSALVRTAAMANALILLPEGPASFDSGDTVTVQVLDWENVTYAEAESA